MRADDAIACCLPDDNGDLRRSNARRPGSARALRIEAVALRPKPALMPRRTPAPPRRRTRLVVSAGMMPKSLYGFGLCTRWRADAALRRLSVGAAAPRAAARNSRPRGPWPRRRRTGYLVKPFKPARSPPLRAGRTLLQVREARRQANEALPAGDRRKDDFLATSVRTMRNSAPRGAESAKRRVVAGSRGGRDHALTTRRSPNPERQVRHITSGWSRPGPRVARVFARRRSTREPAHHAAFRRGWWTARRRSAGRTFARARHRPSRVEPASPKPLALSRFEPGGASEAHVALPPSQQRGQVHPPPRPPVRHPCAPATAAPVPVLSVQDSAGHRGPSCWRALRSSAAAKPILYADGRGPGPSPCSTQAVSRFTAAALRGSAARGPAMAPDRSAALPDRTRCKPKLRSCGRRADGRAAPCRCWWWTTRRLGPDTRPSCLRRLSAHEVDLAHDGRERSAAAARPKAPARWCILRRIACPEGVYGFTCRRRTACRRDIDLKTCGCTRSKQRASANRATDRDWQPASGFDRTWWKPFPTFARLRRAAES